MSNIYPEFTARPENGEARCVQGFAPAISGGDCMFCGLPVRARVHLVEETSRGFEVRYAHQTSLYSGGGWLDLPSARADLVEALDLDDPLTLKHRVEHLVRWLPRR